MKNHRSKRINTNHLNEQKDKKNIQLKFGNSIKQSVNGESDGDDVSVSSDV